MGIIVSFALFSLCLCLRAYAGMAPSPIRPAPIRGLDRACADRADAFSTFRAKASVASIPSGIWQPLGPAPIGPPYLGSGGGYGGANSGRITGLVVIPSGAHQGRIVVATAGGGLWTSDDSGSTWAARSDTAADLAIGSVAVDPSNANHLIAGTGEGNQNGDGYPGAGILFSTDGGTTWTMQNPGGVFTGSHIEQVAIDPTNSNHQFAAADIGLYVTTDGGTTWTSAVGGPVSAVVIDPANASIVYIAGGTNIVSKSTDGGQTWAAANSGIATPGPSRLIALAIAASNPSILYASVGSSNPVVLYQTTNGGGTWSTLSAAPDYTGDSYAYGLSGGTVEQGWYDNVLAVDPANANHLIAGGIALVESSDGGATWTNVNGQAFFGSGANQLHPDQHALAFASDGSVWIGDDGGVFHYLPSTGAVANSNGNLNITQLYFGFNVVGNTLLAGSQDNSSVETTTSTQGAWTGINGGDGGPSATTPNDASVQFIEGNQSLYVTTDGFQTTFNGITPSQVGLFTPPMIVVANSANPANPTVFYGGPDLYRTTDPTDPAPVWAQVTSDGSYVSAIAASPTNSQVIWVGFVDGTIEVSTDGGQSFTAVAAEPSRPQQFVTGLSVNPSNPQEVTASFSYNDTRYKTGYPHVEQYVYSSAPGSGTWTTITGSGLPAAVSRVVYDNGVLIAATDAGVYATDSPNGASTAWLPLGSGLPNVQVQDLYLAGTTLYAVTHGRGAWSVALAGGSTSTTTTVNSGNNPSTFGQSVTFTATVSPSGATGTVSFLDGTTSIGSATLSNGSVSMTTSALSAGSHSISASYSGDATYAASTSTPITQTVGAASSTTTLASNTNPSTYGQSVTFTATVNPSGATGTVSFLDGTTSIGSATLSNGSVSMTTSALSAGSHSISASYSGGGNYAASTSTSLTQTVNTAVSTTTLSSNPNPSFFRQSVTFTATVNPSGATGTVSFLDGRTTLGSATVSNGIASLSTSTLKIGNHTIKASYSGDGNDSASISGALTQNVVPPPLRFNLKAQQSWVYIGGQVQYTLTAVGAYNRLSSAYNGTVNIASNEPGFSGGAVTIVNGQASFTETFATPGRWMVTATDASNARLKGRSNPVAVYLPAVKYLLHGPKSAMVGRSVLFQMTAVDENNRRVPVYSGSATVASTTDPAVSAQVQFKNGLGRFFVIFDTAGAQTVTATDNQNPSITGTSAGVNVVAPRLRLYRPSSTSWTF